MAKLAKLTDALLCLKSADDMQRFLRDLCTPAEIREFEQRWDIAQLLDAGAMSYREIAEKTGASVTTVTRVARFLRDEPHHGYQTALKRLK